MSSEDLAYAEIEKGGPVARRDAVSVQLDTGTFHFVRDGIPHVVDGIRYLPVPFAKVDGFVTQQGNVADSLKITLDGALLLRQIPYLDVATMFDAFQNNRLRKRRLDFHHIVLSNSTREPVGRIHRFAGLIDKAELDREDAEAPEFVVEVLSYRILVQKPVTRLYSDVDQSSLFPGDRSLRHLSDAVFRNGKFVWNKEGSGSGGSIAAGSRDYRRNGVQRERY